MAGKRSATSDLNHDNWNQEDEPEERGTFQKASDVALKTRIMKTAKRRNPIRSEDTDGDKKSAFVGFTAFGSKPASADFSFLKEVSGGAPKTNGIAKQDMSSTSVNIFTTTKSTSIFGGSASTTTSTNMFSSAIVPNSTSSSKKSEKYCSRLKGLNESVTKWISKKVEENPLISLQPVFEDYKKYLEEIEKEESTTSSTTVETKIPTFDFSPEKNNKAIPDSTSETDKKMPTFKFGTPTDSSPKFPSTVSSTAPTFSFGSSGIKPFSSSGSSSTASASFSSSAGIKPFSSTGSSFSSSSGIKPFSAEGSFSTPSPSTIQFPSATGFSFGTEPKQSTSQEDNQEQDEDAPPKVEFKAVVEQDSIYTVKCKVFVKKGDSFVDKGVGNLYLKPIENSEKVQLIVRANTNLGGLLLNFILSESVPTKRMSKRDVMLVAIATPDSKPPPTPVLLRVKSPEEADDLLKVLEKHKK
ncbi:unnamed protein product [Ceutorhynchus assimilis]|uniref:RanBD1 domain-containing protein n=1 Tax=Ceutorhynchus assimilis TaxID=467358 RepID=A0A9N9QK89_9CUCU|nr:unnamed protein product [Ceutorhynchus assimilis]